MKIIIKILLLISILSFLGFKYFGYRCINPRKKELLFIYKNLPIQYKQLTNIRKESNFQNEKKIIDKIYVNNFAKSIVNVLLFIYSSDTREIPYLFYSRTISSILRGKNNAHIKDYALEKFYYSIALMQLDADKVFRLQNYYMEVDDNRKLVNAPIAFPIESKSIPCDLLKSIVY